MNGLPTLFWLAFIVAALAALGIARWVEVMQRRTAERILEDWMRAFPERCPLCSFHRHAVSEGVNVPPLGPHTCPEGRGGPELPEARVVS